MWPAASGASAAARETGSKGVAGAGTAAGRRLYADDHHQALDQLFAVDFGLGTVAQTGANRKRPDTITLWQPELGTKRVFGGEYGLTR
jgi:hypothetical protein